MSKVYLQDTTLTSIGDAIREKKGESTTYLPSEMPAAIQSISGGGEPVIESKTITANGTYTAPEGVDGYSPIVVNVEGGMPIIELSGNCDYLLASSKIQDIVDITNCTYDSNNPITASTYMFYNLPLAKYPNVFKDGSLDAIICAQNCSFTAPAGETFDTYLHFNNLSVNIGNIYSTHSFEKQKIVVNEVLELDDNTTDTPGTMNGLFYNANIDTPLIHYISDRAKKYLGPIFENATFTQQYQNFIFENNSTSNLSYFSIKGGSSSSYPESIFHNVTNESLGNIIVRITNNITCEQILLNGLFFQTRQKTIGNITVEPFSSTSSSYKTSLSCLFYQSDSIREIGDISVPYMPNMWGTFGACSRLKDMPSITVSDLTTTSSSLTFYNLFYNSYCIKNILNLPPGDNSSLTYNVFSDAFKNTACLRRFTFLTNNGVPYERNWNSIIIDLQQAGYCTTGSYYVSEVYGNNKKVSDDATYQALKDTSDWWTTNIQYATYNHDSAVETINSLPDTSSYGTNTIKFKGAAGSATDGGAINTLTAAEIAVATNKGWTVTLV